MTKIFMCKPDYYAIEYEINPWMHKEIYVNKTLAQQQWQELYETILKCGTEVVFIDPIKHLPDIVFTANAGVVLPDNKIYLAQFHHPERQGEQYYFQKWFSQHGYDIVYPDEQIDFEGAGDALFVGETLFAGFGFRSQKIAFDKIKQHGVNEIVYCELKDPYFYHLDTCFCPLDNERALWWPEAFTTDSQQRMQKVKKLIAVPTQDAKKFACNAVVIHNHIIIPTGCDATVKLLQQLHFTVHCCPMSEFIKAGGACKCLTLQL